MSRKRFLNWLLLNTFSIFRKINRRKQPITVTVERLPTMIILSSKFHYPHDNGGIEYSIILDCLNNKEYKTLIEVVLAPYGM